MTTAIFGISNGAINTVVALLMLSLVAMWLALIYRAFVDAERRIEDPVLVRILPLWAVFPFIGYWIYSIIRPPEYLEDAREREVETKAAEARLAMMQNRTCRNCGYEVEPSYLRCPSCLRKLKEPCESCNKPLEPRWRVCPFCEVEVKRAAPAPTEPRPRPARGGERATANKPERATTSAAERQRRSLSSLRTDEDSAPTAPEEATDGADTAEQRLSAAAAIGPKRGAAGSSSKSDAAAAAEAPADPKASSAAAKRSAARRTSGSKKTSSGSRSSRGKK